MPLSGRRYGIDNLTSPTADHFVYSRSQSQLVFGPNLKCFLSRIHSEMPALGTMRVTNLNPRRHSVQEGTRSNIGTQGATSGILRTQSPHHCKIGDG